MVGLPHIMIDGTQSFEYSYDVLLARYEERMALSSNYSLSIEATRVGTSVSTTIDVGMIGAPSPETKVLHLVLTESHIPESWYGGDELNHVERLMIPDHNGTLLISDKGIKNTFDLDFELDPSWMVEHCELVAFLQDTVTKEVVQAQVFDLESTVLTNDVALVEILNPGEEFCSDAIQTVVRIINYGADPLTSCQIDYNLNGEDFSYNWTGNILTNQTEIVSLPEVSFSILENNSVQVELSQPNGVDDEDPTNNLLDKEFTMAMAIQYQNVVLELKTDEFGSETSWDLKDSQGSILYEGTGYENNTVYTFDFELMYDECYQFTISDAGGNGICCESGFGFYKLNDPDGNNFIIGGNFGDMAFESFQTILNTDIDVVIEQDTYKFYPNPTNNQLNIQLEQEMIVSIYDFTGKVCHSKTHPAGKSILDLELNNGMYFLSFQSEDRTITEKLIIVD